MRLENNNETNGRNEDNWTDMANRSLDFDKDT